MRRGVLLFFISMYGCAMQSGISKPDKLLVLDFRDCSDSGVFDQLQMLVPPGYKMSKVQDHQFCEYQLAYGNESVLYIGTNIYDGSQLNARNRYDFGIKTYSINRNVNDTIQSNGLLPNGAHWLEWINGSYVVGYVNVTDTATFNKSISSVHLK